MLSTRIVRYEFAITCTIWQGFGSGSGSGSVLDPDSIQYIAGFRIRIQVRVRIGSGLHPSQWIRIRIRDPDPNSGGLKWPTKVQKNTGSGSVSNVYVSETLLYSVYYMLHVTMIGCELLDGPCMQSLVSYRVFPLLEDRIELWSMLSMG